MDTKHEHETEYMTVGEIAAKAGVTVRTVQYYDQKGLLTPSAKGSRNLRLYSTKDMDRLYRILCYKFLGMPLKEIRERIEKADTEESEASEWMSEALKEKIESEEKILSEQMQRYALLRNLEDYTKEHPVSDWEGYAGLIDYFQEKWKLIWQVSWATSEGKVLDPNGTDKENMKPYYRMFSETMRLMKESVPPQSEEAAEIMAEFERLTQMRSSDEAKMNERDLLFIDPTIMETELIDFSDFWRKVEDYLRAAKEYYKSKR